MDRDRTRQTPGFSLRYSVYAYVTKKKPLGPDDAANESELQIIHLGGKNIQHFNNWNCQMPFYIFHGFLLLLANLEYLHFLLILCQISIFLVHLHCNTAVVFFFIHC